MKGGIMMNAGEALEKLKEGNKRYIASERGNGDISPARRLETAGHGQDPYAVIVACSDSRVIPEEIFSAGIGELFVIRVAGNVVGAHELGSIEYALEHLDCKLAVVLGHTNCGAVGAAIRHDPDGHIKYLTDAIRLAIRDETDDKKASCLNAKHGADKIREAFLRDLPEEKGILVTAALYHIDSGKVDFDI